MKQTAVEFLHSEYKRLFADLLVTPTIGIEIAGSLAKAKEIEREQIERAFYAGCQSERQFKPRVKCWEEYAETTFKK